ncbi:MAG: pyrroline-5-carboxylate reductase [Bacteroidaceae bacterium]|nr:pyrroline-5-carboxylate reductase [Bacteroidaceae bacterium]
MYKSKIAIIGAGAMGGSIADGLLAQAAVPAANLIVSNHTPGRLERFVRSGAVLTTDNRKAVAQADVVILAVKPWLVESVLEDIRDLLTEEKILVSVAAGVSGVQLVQWCGGQCDVLIAIPNIAIAQGASMTFLTPVNASREHTDFVARMFDEMGKTCVCDENHLQAGMALASCGIAYALRYVRAASEGGVEMGFKANQAKEIVMQTLLGAVKLLEASGMHPEEAIDQVTTPGGITIRGLNVMEEAGFTNAVIKGLKASVK